MKKIIDFERQSYPVKLLLAVLMIATVILVVELARWMSPDTISSGGCTTSSTQVDRC